MYWVRLEWPQERTNRSRPGQAGSAGLCAHDLLVEQVGRRRQAHRRAGVAVADLLHGVHGQDAGRVDGLPVEVGPVERGAHAGVLSAQVRCQGEPI